MTDIDPFTALLKGLTLYSPMEKLYVRLYNKNADHGTRGQIGQLMVSHDNYRDAYLEEVVFEPVNSELMIAILSNGAWEVLE